MQVLLPSLIAAVVVELVGPEIPHCLGWGSDFIPCLCLGDVRVEIAVVHYRSLPVDNCQWMEQPQLIGVSVGVIMVVHAVVLPAMLRN